MITDTPLTLSELEELSQLWFECRLSRSDERRLMKILAESQLSSPVIDDARALMGLESARPRKRWRMRGHAHGSRRLNVWMAAASVALVGAVGITLALQTQSSDQDMYVVYVNGKQVEDAEAARQMAEVRYRESMRMIEETEARCNARLMQSQQLINQIN